MTLTWTRRYRFGAVHSLSTGAHRERLHGHGFAVEVTFAGVHPRQLEREVRRSVLERLHARDLNRFLDPATGEALVEWIHRELALTAAGPHIKAVCLQETDKNRFVSGQSEPRYV